MILPVSMTHLGPGTSNDQHYTPVRITEWHLHPIIPQYRPQTVRHAHEGNSHKLFLDSLLNLSVRHKIYTGRRLV